MSQEEDRQLDDAEQVAKELREVGAAFAVFKEKQEEIRRTEEEQAKQALAEAEARRVEEIKQQLSKDE